ncbi:ABC transporter ATP-binding protein [Alkalibacterium olivapovliticus]|uniref:Iron complex transport system ATP-binding protein n=1 Tax=Alkalibacterium olivapovliticus TaxID=99907 RepID=A0A2T0WAG9_9LACT|nr:ABC transporter ATP-binding protein [Alkalibacterium olivapovliticus]PRY83703.1 iron complex transport system ATP-binding protein [Alkalibacterium olivapovliticus]
MSRITTKDLSIGYGKHLIVDGLELTIPDSKITCIIGPNGCGKSTILKTIARLLKPSKGAVLLDGKTIHHQSTKSIAQKIAILAQSPHTPEEMTVKDLVSYGRSPYQKGFGQLTNKDWEMIHWALEETNLLEFADRFVHSLSGGQRQRVWIAMALAQDTDILLLDEPTTYLDLAHQLDVLQVLEKLNKKQNKTIVMVLHDLNHASRFSDYLISIRDGKIVKAGEPAEVMTNQVLRDVFDIDAQIVEDPYTKKPACLTYHLL